MSNILLAWEFGGGLGHVGRLVPIARELLARGHTVHLALRDLADTSKVYRGCGAAVWQAPVFLHQVGGMPPFTANLSEILMGAGYSHPDALEGMLRGWLALFDHLAIDLVVADYAPAAVLAAHLRRRPSITLGLGFYLPPEVTPLPSIVPWAALPPNRLPQSEAAVLKSINTVCERVGGPPVPHVAHLLRGEHAMLTTWPELDHYDPALRTGSDHFVGPNEEPAVGVSPQWPAGEGPCVAAYLKAGHALHGQVLQTLSDLDCRVACYLPEVASGKPPPVRSPRIWYAPEPLNLREALRTSRLLVCHAGHGTMAQALRARVPMLLLPMQNEQALIARRVQAQGWGVDALTLGPRPDFRPSLEALLRCGPLPEIFEGRRNDCTAAVLARIEQALAGTDA